MIYSLLLTVAGLFLIGAGYRKYLNRHRGPTTKSWLVDSAIGMICLGLAATNSFFYSIYYIPSESMTPLLKPGDWVVVKKSGIDSNIDYLRHRVVVLKETGSGDIYIKRIIAGPGEWVSWDGEQLLVNGESIAINDQDCGRSRDGVEAIYTFMDEGNVQGKWDVSKGLFAAGINICNSVDSRAYGTVNPGAIIGEAIMVCHEATCKKLQEYHP